MPEASSQGVSNQGQFEARIATIRKRFAAKFAATLRLAAQAEMQILDSNRG